MKNVLLMALATATLTTTARGSYAGAPISDEDVQARLERNSAVNLTPRSADQALNAALLGLRQWNQPLFYAQAGTIPLLGEHPGIVLPLTGSLSAQQHVPAADGDYLVELPAGTTLLVTALNPDTQQLTVRAFAPGQPARTVLMRADHADEAHGAMPGHSLLGDVCSRLRDLQDVLMRPGGTWVHRDGRRLA